MSPEEWVGQIFMPAISDTGSNGTPVMTPELVKMLDTIHPGGVILFARDLQSPEQILTLTDDLQKNGTVLSDGEKKAEIPSFNPLIYLHKSGKPD